MHFTLKKKDILHYARTFTRRPTHNNFYDDKFSVFLYRNGKCKKPKQSNEVLGEKELERQQSKTKKNEKMKRTFTPFSYGVWLYVFVIGFTA